MAFLRLIRRFIPAGLLRRYHHWLAQYGAWRYHYPARQLVVIGVTGTKGKSTTCNLIWHFLTAAGYTVGMTTTANFRMGDRQWLNATKMTMLGRTQLQAMLADMVKAGCQYAVIETSSEGIAQWRHLGIDYDSMVFTNLYPEHLDAHGGFENYRAVKVGWFKQVSRSPIKLLQQRTIPKAAVMNGDSDQAAYFLAAATVPTKIIWTYHNAAGANLVASQVVASATGLSFQLGQYQFTSQLLGEWNMDNILSAIGVALTQGLSYPQLVAALASFTSVPGRMERINCGQPFSVLVDYAYEPVSLRLLYSFWRQHSPATTRLITLISSTGGGRDIGRRSQNGAVAGELCDYVIVTDEDPYDDDPQVIIDQVAQGVATAGKIEGQTFWRIRDRREAMRAAFHLAQPDDVVLLTCKGADQKICRANGKKESWDDRVVAKEELKKLS